MSRFTLNFALALILRELRRRSIQLAELLPSTSSLTANRYLRLMLIAIAEILCTIPIAAYGLYLNLGTGSVRPWISWADTHYNWSAVHLYPSVLWREDHLTTVAIELSRWLPIFCALMFFAFFGFAEEARKHYRQAFMKVAAFLGLRRRHTRYALLLVVYCLLLTSSTAVLCLCPKSHTSRPVSCLV
jgi:pheromone a factor receptor